MNEAEFTEAQKTYLLIALFYFLLKFYFTCILYQFARRLEVEEQVRQDDEEIAEEERKAEEARL